MKATPYILLLLVLLAACAQQGEREEMHELPASTEAYYRDALEAIDELVEQYPNNAHGYYQKAKVQEALGNTNQAILNLKRAVKFDSTNQFYRRQLARLFLEDGNLKRAEEYIVQAQQLGDRSADTYAMLARVLYGQQQYTPAQNYLNRALESEPYRLEWLLLKANLYKAEGDTNRAVSFLEERAAGQAASPELLALLAQNYADLGRFAKALEFSTRKNRLEPAGPEEQIQQARWLAAADRPDTAVAVLKRLAGQPAYQLSVALALGQVYTGQNQLDSAQKFLNQVIMLDSRVKEAYFWLGKVYDRQRQYYTARDQLQNALLLDTAYAEAQQALAEVEQKIYWIQRRRQQEEAARQLPILQPLTPTIGNE